MTGAEMKAWRERLGKDEAWADRVLGAVYLPGLGTGYGDCRRPVIEKMSRAGEYGPEQTTALLTAYRAALEAEEARQAAERAQAEPVCPEGVACWSGLGGEARVGIANNGASTAVITVRADGSMTTTPSAPLAATPALLRYAADLSDYRARKHAAEGDRQRKLEAVRAAEEAYAKAGDAVRAAERECDKASDALVAARREAGL